MTLDTALIQAAKTKEKTRELVHVLIQEGASVHWMNGEAFRTLVQDGRYSVADYLLAEAGADPNLLDYDQLTKLCKTARPSFLQRLVDHGLKMDRLGQRCLMVAMESRHFHVVQWIIPLLSPRQLDAAVPSAISWSQKSVLQQLMAHGANVRYNDNESLRSAVRVGQVETVQDLLEHGARVEAKDFMALKVAVSQKNQAMLQLLLDAAFPRGDTTNPMVGGRNTAMLELPMDVAPKEQINQYRFYSSVPDVMEELVLLAIRGGDLPMLQYLSMQVAPTIRNPLLACRDHLPLLSAIDQGDVKMVKWFLSQPKFTLTKDGSFLLRAADHGNPKICEMLLNAGAPVSQIAVELAALGGHREALEVLLTTRTGGKAKIKSSKQTTTKLTTKKQLVRWNDHENAAIWAAANGEQWELLKYMASAGADFTGLETDVALLASQHGQLLDWVRALLIRQEMFPSLAPAHLPRTIWDVCLSNMDQRCLRLLCVHDRPGLLAFGEVLIEEATAKEGTTVIVNLLQRELERAKESISTAPVTASNTAPVRSPARRTNSVMLGSRWRL